MPTNASRSISSRPVGSSGSQAATVTIRGLLPELKARLRIRAAHNARSMEAEARAILEAALGEAEEDPADLATFARTLFISLGGVELALPPRDPAREPPDFGTGVEVSPARLDQLPAPLKPPARASTKGRPRR